MKDTRTYSREINAAVNDSKITQLQRDCISEIALLCRKRKRAEMKKKIFACLAACFYASALIFSLFGVFSKNEKNSSKTVFSVLAAFFVFFGTTFTALCCKQCRIEKEFSNGIAFLEGTVESSEHITE